MITKANKNAYKWCDLILILLIRYISFSIIFSICIPIQYLFIKISSISNSRYNATIWLCLEYNISIVLQGKVD